MKHISVGIVGARKRHSSKDKDLIKNYLQGLIDDGYDDILVISGGCASGADQFAYELARSMGLHILIFFPDIKKLPQKSTRADYAKIAHERNALIAKSCDVLVALPHEEGSGTQDTMERARKLEKEVVEL